jgi:hypothetical protein
VSESQPFCLLRYINDIWYVGVPYIIMRRCVVFHRDLSLTFDFKVK